MDQNLLARIGRLLLLQAVAFQLRCLEAVGHNSPLESGRRLTGQAEWQFDGSVDTSTISCTGGHYPPPLCTAENIALNHASKVFTVYEDAPDTNTMEYADKYLFRMSAEPHSNLPKCDQTLDEAYIFTFFFYYGNSNYFHLHKDTLFPIFSLLDKKRKAEDAENRRKHAPVVLMPVVEKRRMAEVDWDSGAFSDQYLDRYFIQVLETLAGTNNPILPLDSDLTKKSPNGFTCFRKATIGAPSVRDEEDSFIKPFVSFMMGERLKVQRGQPSEARVGLIKRGGRRKVLNEDELIAAVRAFVPAELVEFSGMSYREQVSAVQHYTVLIGMNGAGFMNAIYLPEGAVAIQLAPFNATMLNVKEFGSIVAARGPYLFWRNTHPELHHTSPGDQYNSQANTRVKVDEFVDLVKRALGMGINSELWSDPGKTEL